MTDQSSACKVCRTAERWGLDVEEWMRARRVDDELSLRELQDAYNTTMLSAIISQTADGEEVLAEWAPETIYDQLRSDDPEIPIESYLSDAGVNTDQVRKDFVSYQTIRHHLNSCLDIDTDTRPTLTAEKIIQRTTELQNRVESVSITEINRLEKNEIVTAGDITVNTAVTVTCGECGMVSPFRVFVAREGYYCDETG